MFIISLLSTTNLFLIKPYDNPICQRNEFFNEVIIIFSIYCILCFTEFVQDPVKQYQIGYMFCILVLLHLAVNIIIIEITFFRSLRMKLIKC